MIATTLIGHFLARGGLESGKYQEEIQMPWALTKDPRNNTEITAQLGYIPTQFDKPGKVTLR